MCPFYSPFLPTNGFCGCFSSWFRSNLYQKQAAKDSFEITQDFTRVAFQPFLFPYQFLAEQET